MRRMTAQAACDGFGFGGAMLLTALVIWWHPDARLRSAPRPQSPAVMLSVIAAPPAPPPQPAPAPPLVSPPPAVLPPPPPPVAVPLRPAPVALPRVVVHRVRPKVSPIVERPTQEASPAARVAPQAAFEVPPTDAPVRDVAQDDRYVAGLHAYLLGRTAPPDSAVYRLLRPYGTADIGFALGRDGAVRNVHVLRGSGSALLDRQALAIVQGGRYPAMPAAAFAGETEHIFHIPIEFRPTVTGE